MSRLIGDMTGNIFEEADSGFGLVSQPKSYKRPLLSAEAQPRGASGFVGLQNQGMTCYLNSLLQTMFLTPELRAGLYHVPLQELGMNADEMQPEAAAAEPIGANSEKHEEPKEGQKDEGAAAMESLMGMGFPVDEVERALKKFHNDLQRAAEWLLARAGSGDKVELPDDDTDMYEDLPPLEAPGADNSNPLMGSEELPVSMILDGGTTEAPLSGAAQSVVDAFKKRWQDMDETCMETDELPLSQKSVNGAEGSEEHGSETQGGRNKETEDAEEKEGGEAAAAIGGRNNAEAPAIAAPPKPKRRRRGLIIELQKAFAWLQAVDQKAISTEDLTRVFGWDGSEARVQHDVHELNRILFESVEFYLKGTQQESLVKDLYHGTLVNQVECLRCGAVSERHEEFSDIPVVVKGFSSLEESLAAAAKAEMLDGDNQYFCERCQAKVDAQRSQRFRSLPPLLTLPLCRFEYDWDRDERRKITTPFSFPLTLNLAPYMAPPAPDGQPGTQDAAANGSTGGAALFDLLSVVIHSGSAHSGHYHAYIRDMLNEGKGGPEEPTTGQDVARGFDAAVEMEGQVRGGMLFEGAGFNEGLEQAGSAMHALVEAAVQESGRDAAAGAPHQDGQGGREKPEKTSVGGSPEGPAEGVDEPEYGQWYDFNDSNVSAVHWSAITGQFGGGNECAYMLTYRARLPPGQLLAPPALAAVSHEAHEGGEAAAPAANGTSHAGSSEATGEGPLGEASCQDVARRALAVPGHLAPLVHRKNEQLREERRVAEETAAREAAEAEAVRAANQVRLFVHVPDDGYVRNGYLFSRHEDLSDVGRFLVLERSSTVGQLSVMVRQWCAVHASALALYIVSPKIDTQDCEEPADEQGQAPGGFGGLVDWRAESGEVGKEAESVTEDIVLDEDGEGVDKQASAGGAGRTGDADTGMRDATPDVSILAKGESEHLAGTSAREGEGLNGRGLEEPRGAYPPQRRLTDVFEGVAQNGAERAGVRDGPSGKAGVDRVGTSSSGSSADSRSRGVKRAAEGGELQSRGKFQPEIIRGPQLLEFREPTEPQTSSESERRSAGAGEGPAAAEGSGASLSGSGGAGLAEGLSGVKLARQADGDGASMQDAPCLTVEQPRMKKVRRTIYEITGRLNMRDTAQKLGEQIENGGGVLAWSTVDKPPHGVDFPEAEGMTSMNEGGGVGHGWTSSVDNGWDAQPSGWGSPPRNAPLFTVKVYIHVDPNARTCLESFPVEANTSVWMLKSEALKQYRAQAHEALGEDDVVLCRQAATGGPGEAYHDNVLVTQAGITDQQELWLQRRAAAPSSSSSVLRLTMTVYGKDGMAAAQVPIEMPRAALLVELVVHASERGAATIREHAAAIGADASEAPQLVVWRDLAFGGKKALNVDQDALRTLEDLGFEEGDQLLVEDRDAVSPETVTVRVQRYVLPHDRDADEPCAKFLAATMAATSNLHGPAEAPPPGGDEAQDQQAIADQANSLAAVLTAELAKRRPTRTTGGRGEASQRGAGAPPPRLGKGLGRGLGLGAGLSRSRAQLKELAPGVQVAAPPGRAAPQSGGDQDGGGRGPAPLQSPYSAMAAADADGSPPARLPKRLQRTGSSTTAREQDAAPLRGDGRPAAARSALASPMRFQQAGVPEWCFWPVDEVVLPKSATLADLKRRILALPAFKSARDAGALPALTGLRVREVRGGAEAPQLGKEYRDLDTDLAQLGLAAGQHLAARILPPDERPVEEGPLSDCDSLPELVDYTEDDGSGGSNAASRAHAALDTAMGEASAELDLGEAAAGFGGGGAGLDLPTSSGSDTSGGARGRAGPALERGSTSMEVAVGDDPGDEVDSSAGLPDPGDLHQPLAHADPTHDQRSSPPAPRRRRTGPSRHALVLTVQRRVPLPLPQIPPVPVSLARRAVEALGPATRDAATGPGGLPLADASVNVRASPAPSPLVSPYFQAAASQVGAKQGGSATEAGPSHGEVAGSVPLPSPVPETIPLPQYLTGPPGGPASDSGSGPRPTRSLPLSDASLGFMPLAKKSPTAVAYSNPAPPMQLSIPDPSELPSWGQPRASPVHPPSTPAAAAPTPAPSREAQTGMQVLFHVASHLQAQTGATPANLHFLQQQTADTAPQGFPPPPPNGLASPPPVKRQFVFTSPEEVTLDTGRAVLTAAELKAVLAAHFGIRAAALRVIKVDAAKLKVLPEDDTAGSKAGRGAHDRFDGDAPTSLDGGPGLGKAGKGKGAMGKAGLRPSNASLGASVNLKGRPFQLRDGDTIVVMDAADDPDQEDPWCADSIGTGLGSRVKLGPAPLNTTWEGSGYHKGPSIGPTEKKHRRPEATLRIRMDEYD